MLTEAQSKVLRSRKDALSEDESVLSNRTAIRMSVNGEVCQPDEVTTENTIVYHRKKGRNSARDK